jgi:hypothetical protein
MTVKVTRKCTKQADRKDLSILLKRTFQQIVKLSYVIEIALTVLKQKFVQVLVCPGGPPEIENRKCKEQHHQHNHIYFTNIRHYREQHHQHNHIYLLTLDVTK